MYIPTYTDDPLLATPANSISKQSDEPPHYGTLFGLNRRDFVGNVDGMEEELYGNHIDKMNEEDLGPGTLTDLMRFLVLGVLGGILVVDKSYLQL
jgi:hypothetical protein